MYRAVLVMTLFTLAAAQYFYPINEDEGNYIELIRIPRALRNQPSLIPSSPLPPRVGAPGGIPLPSYHSNRNGPPMIGYEPIASGSKKEPLVTAESHGHGHHHGHDYVDYGAYTGGWGAFGWYTDHPVHSYGH
ncbi:unnamed protein product [Orchesella dallaii]|uniref:Uncharacterized protein n=1 Tax=Orchesella dallaii TaxID=48710 RepID=A0ABP1QM99_9HEXA